MAGLVKAKKFLWRDSNLEFFGSNTEKQVSSENRIVFKLYRRDGIEFTCEFRSMPFTELYRTPGTKLFRIVLTDADILISGINWNDLIQGACTEIIYFYSS